jgi:hypothetical protein
MTNISRSKHLPGTIVGIVRHRETWRFEEAPVATTQTSYSSIPLAEAGPEAARRGFGLGLSPGPDTGRGRVYMRRDFDIRSFGVNAFFQASSGATVIGEHDELGPAAGGHEELYVVIQGSCTFPVGGEEIDAPHGTAVFVGDPAVKRGARANEDDTIVLAVGGRPGEAFEVGPSETMAPFFGLYRDKDYESALAVCRDALETHPGNALILYNVACLENRLGRQDEALDRLRESLAAWPAYKELAAADDDLASLRDDARFTALVA